MGKISSFLKPSKLGYQDGQILLVVVLATVIALTVGLSAITRTITNTRLSTEEANSQKALSAAEAGIEQLLNDPTAAFNKKDLSNQSSFTANSKPIPTSLPFNLNDGNIILKDDGTDIWLTNQADFSGTPWNGTLNLYWVKNENDDCKSAAIEIIIIEGDRNDPSMRRETADPCSSRNNNFGGATNGSFNISGVIYDYEKDVTITNGGYIARVIPFYQDTYMAVNATSALPIQGYVIESTGTSGDTTRKLRVYRANPRVPIEFFPYNVFLP